jgi:hypothetical protein
VADYTAPTPAEVAGVLLNRAQTALAECGSDPLDAVYVAAGAIAWDTCCGMLVAAPERIYRSDTFPGESSTVICESGDLTLDMLVLLLRCVPVLDDQGNPPAPEAMDEAYGAILRDAAIIWNALAGPLPEGWLRANLNQMFLGAEGGCIGVETRVTIGLAQESWCPEC